MHPDRKNKILLAAIFAIAAGQFIWDSLIPNGLTDWVWYTIPILLSARVEGRKFTFKLVGLFSFLMLLAFCVSPRGIDPKLALTGRLIGIGAFWLMAWLIYLQKGLQTALQNTNRALRSVSACNQILVTATKEPELLSDICRVFVSKGGYRLVWVGYAEDDAEKTVRCAAWAGVHPEYLQRAKISWSDATERGRGPTGHAIRTGEIIACSNIQTDDRLAPWRRDAERYGLKSSITVPLRTSERVFGVLIIYAGEPDVFRQEEVELIKELANNMAFGIEAIRTKLERQAAEAARQDNENRLQFLLTNTPVIIYSLHNAENYPTRFISANVREVLGHPPEAFMEDIGFWFAHLHPEDVTPALESFHVQQVLNVVVREYRFRHADGSYRWMHDEMRVVRDANGAIREFIGYWVDITTRKQSEERDARLAAIVNSSDDAIIGKTLEGIITSWNRGAEQLFGYSAKEAVGQPSLMLFPPELATQEAQILSRITRGENIPHFDTVRLRRGGQPIDVSVTISPIIDPSGKVVGAATIVRDITERKQAEGALLTANRKVIRQNNLLNALHQIHGAIAQAVDRRALLQYVCDLLVQRRGYVSVWVGELDSGTQTVQAAAYAGLPQNFLKHAPIRWDDSPFGNGPTGLAVRTRQTVVFDELANDPRFAPWRESVVACGAASIASIPLIYADKLHGVLTVKADHVAAFDAGEIELLNSLASNLGSALERIETTIALRRTENNLLALLNATTREAFLLALDGQVLLANEVKARNLGCTVEALVGSNIFDRQPPGLRESRLARVQEVIATGRPLQFADESQGRYVDHSLMPVRNEAGQVTGVAVYSEDVTARREADRLLRENQERLQLALQVSNQGIYDIVNLQTGEIFTSPEYARLLGYEPEGFKLTHTQWSQWVHPDDQEMVRQAFGGFVAGELPEYRIEYRLRTREGGWIWVFSTARIIEREATGQPKRVLGTVTDITRRKASEEASDRLIVAIDQSVESIVFTDQRGIILYVNQGFEKVTGYRREEVIGQSTRLLKSDRHPPEFYKELWETISSGRVWRGRITNRRKDGQIFIEDATISPVRNTRGEIISYVAAKHDITREIALERQLIESQKMEAIGQLAGGVAHDYNNILATNMIQLGMLLAEPGLDAEVRESLDALKRSNDRAAKLTRQLLMFSRRQAMEKKRVELNGLVDEELKMLRRLLGDNLKLVLQVSAGEAWVEADPGMLEQVLMNLCINARDAMPQGGRLVVSVAPLTVEAAALPQHPEAHPGNFIRVSVADNGCGMSAETMGHIFEPFFTTKPVGKGTGLGLATVYGIVRQHEGWIEVTSELGHGSEFHIYLPACPAGSPGGAVSPSSGDRPVSETVLVVEDEDELRESVVAYLRSAGYRVFAATNGREALEQWSEQIGKMDALLTDMVMPGGVSGLELAQALRALKPGLPTVIMSGYNKELAQTGVLPGTGFFYQAKPCEPQDLSAALRKVLEQVKPVPPNTLPAR